MVTYIFYRRHNISIFIIFLNLEINKYFFIGQKKRYEACKNPLLWNANYERENNDYTNAFRPRRFKWGDFLTNFI